MLNWSVLAAMTTRIFTQARNFAKKDERSAPQLVLRITCSYRKYEQSKTKQNFLEKFTKKMHEARTKCPQVNFSNGVPNVLALRYANCMANCCMAAASLLLYLAVGENLREENA